MLYLKLVRVMEKVIKNGEVAVLISPGYGIGWYSQHGIKSLLFHPKLVELVEQNRKEEITEELCKELVGDLRDETFICTLGARDLKIYWVKEGSAIRITEFDGFEKLHILEEDIIAI